MLSRKEYPDLLDFLSSVPIRREVKKPFFGKPYLPFHAYCHILSFLYEDGALLGRAKRDKLNILKKMFVIPGIKPMESAQETAKGMLDQFRKEAGGEPHSFYDFIEHYYLERALKPYGLTLLPRNEGEARKIRKVCEAKIPLTNAIPNIKLHLLDGIGFGSSFPDLTEEMFRRSYEAGMYYDTSVRDKRSERPMKIYTLEEREKPVLLALAAYTSEFYPELIAPLDLQREVEEVKKQREEMEREG